MTDEFLQKILDILTGISQNLEPIPFWQNYAFWISLGNIIVLSITLFWLIKYTRATEKIVENQMMPAIDVNMIFDQNSKKTYFWFLNASAIPGLVSITLFVKDKKYEIGPLRIHPYHPQIINFKKTATTFDFLQNNFANGKEATLEITIKPAVGNQKIKSSFIKNYKFNEKNNEWDESSWGFPDLPFPSNN